MITTVKEKEKMMIDKFLELNDVETDELGRIVIKDLNVLEQINGAVAGDLGFMVSDGACGNSNCVC